MTDNEFSTPKITPTDSVKMPSVSSETSGYMLASEFKEYATLEVNERIDALAGGIIPKGEIASADLPEASSENQGWMYWLTDLEKYVVSDGTDWVDFGSYPIESYATFEDLPVSGLPNKIYITTTDKVLYWWDGSAYVSSFSNLVDGTTVVGKASADASGNTITTTYETKADHALDISIINKRIDNLEQTSGQTEIEVSYPDDVLYSPNLVPPKSAKWAGIKSLRGKTRAWNQIVDPSQVGTMTTFSDGKYTINETISSARTALKNIHMESGHRYLFFFNLKSGTLADILRLYVAGGGYVDSFFGSTSRTWTFDCTTTGDYQLNAVVDVSTTINITFEFFCRDLTIIFPDNTPTTVADALQRSADLAVWDAYGYSLVTETVSGVKSVFKNLFNKATTIDGKFLNSSATEITQGTMCYSDKIPVTVGKTYILSGYGAVSSEATKLLFGFDASDNLVVTTSSTGENSLTIPVGVSYLRFNCVLANKDTAQLELGSTATTYSEYKAPSILTLPTPFSGKSAGSVAEVYDLETGKVSHPVKEIDLGDLTWGYNSGGPNFYSNSLQSVIRKPTADSQTPNMTCSMFKPSSNSSATTGNIYVSTSGQLRVKDPSGGTDADAFTTAVTGQKLVYELATPDPDTTVTTMNDPTIEVQGGGTIETVQTQTPVIDNCMDVTYDIIP